MRNKTRWTTLTAVATTKMELTFELKVRTHMSGPWATVPTTEVKLHDYPTDEFLKGFAVGYAKALNQEPLEIRWNFKNSGQGHYLDIFTEVL